MRKYDKTKDEFIEKKLLLLEGKYEEYKIKAKGKNKDSKSPKRIMDFESFAFKRERMIIKEHSQQDLRLLKMTYEYQKSSLTWLLFCFPFYLMILYTNSIHTVLNGLWLPFALAGSFYVSYRLRDLTLINIEYEKAYEKTILKSLSGSAGLIIINIILYLAYSGEYAAYYLVLPTLFIATIGLCGLIFSSKKEDEVLKVSKGIVVLSKKRIKQSGKNKPFIM